MRTTIILKDELVKQAMDITGIKEKTALIHAGLLALLEQGARNKLIALGGAGKKSTQTPIRRRRPA